MTAKLLFIKLMAFMVFFVACKKESTIDLNPTSSGTAYLLTRVINDADTVLHAEYNDENQLVKFTTSLAICDSMVYNSVGNLMSCRQTINNDIVTVFHTNFTYSKDVIQVISRSPSYTTVKKYTLLNGKIVKREKGFVYQGVPSYINSDTVSYLYKDENLVKSIFPFRTIEYQPIDKFTYSDHYFNPYRTLGNHVYTLLTDDFSIAGSKSVLLAESKNLPSLESYATYSISDMTLLFSGFVTYNTLVIDRLAESESLPEVIKTTDNKGIETTLRFTYIKM